MPPLARLLPGVFAFALAVVSSVAATAATAMRYDKAAFNRALAVGAPVVVMSAPAGRRCAKRKSRSSAPC